MPRVACRVAASLLLLTCSTQVAKADSVVEILGKVKTFRDAGLELFSSLSKKLKETGQADLSEKADNFCKDWFSVLGVQKGLTGLAKDFAFNYLGRSAYHSSNGELVTAIQKVGTSFPDEDGEEFDDESVEDLQYYLKKMCSEGKKIFKEGGSLHDMLSELLALLETPGVEKALSDSLKESSVIKDAFSYLSGPIPRVVRGKDEDGKKEL